VVDGVEPTTAGAADGEAAGEASAGRAGLGAGDDPAGEAAAGVVPGAAAPPPPHADRLRLMAAQMLSRPTWIALRLNRSLASPDVNLAQYSEASYSTGTHLTSCTSLLNNRAHACDALVTHS
jgi:hypothetical protein